MAARHPRSWPGRHRRSPGSSARRPDGRRRSRPSERALEIALLVGDPSAEAVARIRVARAIAALGRQADGEDEAERALALARRTRDRSIVGLVFTLAARVHEGGGDAAGAARIHDEAAALIADLRIRMMDVEIVRAWNHFQVGDWTTTLALLAEHERLGSPYDSRFHLLSALVNARSGRRDAAASHVAQFLDQEASTEAVVLAECALWSDRPDDAAARASEGLAAPDEPYAFETWKGWLYRALARAEADVADRARRRRRTEEAEAAARRAEAAASSLVALTEGPLTYRDVFGAELPGSVALARAEAARAAGRPEPELWARAAAGVGHARAALRGRVRTVARRRGAARRGRASRRGARSSGRGGDDRPPARGGGDRGARRRAGGQGADHPARSGRGRGLPPPAVPRSVRR